MRRFKWIWISLFWIVTTLVLLEGGLRTVGKSLPGQLGITARYIMTGKPYAEDWTPAWRENHDHYYALRPDIDNTLQYGSPTVSFHLTTHKLWDDGLPPDEGIGFRTKPVDYQVDAVVVGDSFSFCFTEEDDCWVNILAQKTGLGIANLGQPVTGTISHARILQDFGAPLKPPVVIWQFFGNDFNDDYGLLQWRGDIEPILDTDSTSSPTPTNQSNSSDIVDWLRHNSVAFAVMEVALTGSWGGLPDDQTVFTPNYSAPYGDGQVLQFGKLYERTALDMSRPANQFGLEQSRAAFQSSLDLIDSWQGEMVVVIIPTREEVYDTLTEPLMGKTELDKQRSARLAMLDLCSELKLSCIDPLADFQTRAHQGEALYYSDDMHLNSAGNAALATIVQQWIESSTIAGLTK
ncbi:MAG TPA: hypothetical protein VHL11_20190 [Phototrophicaceae bacterium]|nr:hypothetical protein [Phototrophicaceae bacterium]